MIDKMTVVTAVATSVIINVATTLIVITDPVDRSSSGSSIWATEMAKV